MSCMSGEGSGVFNLQMSGGEARREGDGTGKGDLLLDAGDLDDLVVHGIEEREQILDAFSRPVT